MISKAKWKITNSSLQGHYLYLDKYNFNLPRDKKSKIKYNRFKDIKVKDKIDKRC